MEIKIRFTFKILFIILNFFALSLSAQTPGKEYSENWKRVEDFEKQNLTTSALNEVNQIYTLAKKDNNEPQVIKSLLFKSKFLSTLTEDAAQKIIDTLELEITQSTGAARSILQSITAQVFQNYFSYHRGRLYSAGNTQNFVKKDIATWSTSDFIEKIASLYEASLSNKETQTISLQPFDPILKLGNSRRLRPTVFDLLAHRAISFFKSSENDLNRPSYYFEIDDEKAFAPADDFIKAAFESRDSGSLHLKAIRVFQELTKFHSDDPAPLVHVELERLEFMNRFAVMSDKQEVYIKALKGIYEMYPIPDAAKAGYLWGQQLWTMSADRSNDERAKLLLEAVDILKEVSGRFRFSEGAIQARNTLNEIMHPALNIKTERVNSKNKPFRALVSYTNLNGVYLRVIPITKKERDLINGINKQGERFAMISTLKHQVQWKQALPDIGDYLQHQAEIKINGLGPGEYILLASKNSDFGISENLMTANFIHVSNISYINFEQNYFVLDRETGKPITGADVRIFREVYNYNTRKYTSEHKGNATTDKSGFFRIPEMNPSGASNLKLEITAAGDYLFLNDNQPVYTYNSFIRKDNFKTQEEIDKAYAQIFFFTDRSIYRPGQTVYYKGIGVTQKLETSKSELLPEGTPVKIILYNSFNLKVDSIETTLNEYGSFSGKFILPENQLNGNYRITVEEYPNRSVSFSVEEYKRPKFFVDFDKITETYRVNDTVQLTGFAEGYAGNRIDGAMVKYRVTRVPRFIYPWLFWNRGLPRFTSMEIVHGEAIADENGSFTINFKAIPDRQIDPKMEPVFDYSVTAEVTDINGETRTSTTFIPVGYKALDLQIGITDKGTFSADDLKHIVLTAKNLSGEPQKVEAKIKIYSLKTPGRVLRDRLWDTPDMFVMPEAEFIKNFPHDIYKDENNPAAWDIRSTLISKTDTVNGTLRFSSNKHLASGWYRIEATSEDRFGNPVKDIKYFRVIQPGEKKVVGSDFFISNLSSKTFAPGDRASVYISSPEEIHLIQHTDYTSDNSTDSVPDFKFYNLKNETGSFIFDVEEKDRGGFGVLSFFVKNNRFYYSKSVVTVPWSNKKLSISFDTYRDKTLPGSEENWKVSIKGNDGEKVAAEMVASMYDASLDQFRTHSWNPLSVWGNYYSLTNWNGRQNFTSVSAQQLSFPVLWETVASKTFDEISPMPSLYLGYYTGLLRGANVMLNRKAEVKGVEEAAMAAPVEDSMADEIAGEPGQHGQQEEQSQPETEQAAPIRTNFNETAFFYPELLTNAEGNISFSFTMPEALTTWKLMAHAHTKDLSSGYAEMTTVTQKDLMVIPNAPRFFREGDKMEFSAKVVNMTDSEMYAEVEFHLLNAATMLPVDKWFDNIDLKKSITLKGAQSKAVTFSINIPKGFNDAVVYRITAKSENASDGEEAFIPVLTNRMLVTESLPIEMKTDGSKTFRFDKLLQSSNSSTLTNFGLTVEYTPDPVWYAVQALPYLTNKTRESTEQIANRYFANALAAHIANSSPKIKTIFEKWRSADTAALLSNLQKNQELKSVLLEETPWVLQARNEEEQKRNIALLFDIVRMTEELNNTLKTVQDRQSSNGGFVWFKGGPDDRYMTQHILATFGHLKKLNAWPEKNKEQMTSIAAKAMPYLDGRIAEDYQKLLQSKANLKEQQPGSLAIHYLYTRSFFTEVPISKNAQEAYDYYMKQAEKYWTSQSIYMKGMTALVLCRSGNTATAAKIMKALKENAITNKTLGMYWKEWNTRSWWWYQAPIESQALMIEAFTEVAKDDKSVAELKLWLLKNKQTNNWKTSKATAEAVYALLLEGSDWLTIEKNARIELGTTVFENKNELQESGTGYFKRKIDGAMVQPEMGNITVTVSQPGVKKSKSSPSWGSVYWQYFEDLDKISFAETPLQLSKKLFVEKNTDHGPVLVPVNDGDKLKVGDKIKVRIELRADRDMEYVHMKDMRASAMEPVNVLSAYKWQGGLGYYESTGDASTNFFFNRLPRGTYVFEYPLHITHSGNFSNGITSIQCLYAPEFMAHSEGVRIEVE